MTPFYQDDFATLYHGDFREVFAALGVSADAAIADPPYGETSLEWDSWPGGWPAAIASHIRPAGGMWCFGSLRMFMENASDFAPWRMSQDIVWEKHNGSSFHADRFKRVHELAAFFYRGAWSDVFKAPQYTNDATKRTVRRKHRPPHTGHIAASSYVSQDGGPRLMTSVVYARSCHGYAQNETQKPLEIIRPLIRYACPPGGLVAVPFAGAGSDMVAAKEMGVRSIGCEVRLDQCDAAAGRLRQGVLFVEGSA